MVQHAFNSHPSISDGLSESLPANIYCVILYNAKVTGAENPPRN